MFANRVAAVTCLPYEHNYNGDTRVYIGVVMLLFIIKHATSSD